MLFAQIKRKPHGLVLQDDIRQVRKNNSSEAVEFVRFIDSKFKFPTKKNKGRLVPAIVVDTNETHIIVDFKGKQEGWIPIEEMNLAGFGAIPKIGDTVEVWVQGDNISFSKGAQIRAWKTLELHYKNRKPIEGIISEKTPNGFLVWILPQGAKAFLPISQLESSSQIVKNPQALQKYKEIPHSYTIIKMDKNTDKGMFVVLSRKIDSQSISDSSSDNSSAPNNNNNNPKYSQNDKNRS